MGAELRRTRVGRYGGLGLSALLIVIAGCGSGREVTPESVRAARQLWDRAGIRDYDLDWTVTGPNNAHYFVTVRGGDVLKIESVQRDGARVELHSGKQQYFGVDGLFRTLDEELAVCSKRDEPFGAPKGTKVVMRFEPDEKLGYPRWYHRDVLGTRTSMAIDVNALTPVRAASH